MCARQRRSNYDAYGNYDDVRPTRATLGDWVRAWRSVMRDPDKPIPEPGLGPEGDPIPEDLDLRCPSCSYDISGLTEWRCPECGEPFNPRRAYTLRMLRQPEYFLRYRLAPEDIRKTFWALVLLIGGIALTVVAAVLSARVATGPIGAIPVSYGITGLSAFLFLSLPTLILMHFMMDIPWPRILFYLSVPWFLLCVALLATVLL